MVLAVYGMVQSVHKWNTSNIEHVCYSVSALDRIWNNEKDGIFSQSMLIHQVRPAHTYPIPPWEMIHPPGGDNAVCM
jgi:hypothetical protein